MCVLQSYAFKLRSFVFLRLQDTLIVWAEADNYDLALSFQEKSGCDEIWEKICHVCVECDCLYFLNVHTVHRGMIPYPEIALYVQINS